MRERREALLTAAAVALIAVHLALALNAALRESATFDEIAHLPAGWTYLAWGDVLLNPEHPPLLKRIAAFPLLLAGVDAPPEARALWLQARFNRRVQWPFGHAFLYGEGRDATRLLLLGRLPMAVLSALIGLVVWLWARALLGPGGALAATALWAFDPNLLAHGPLVNTDAGVTLFILAASAGLWRCLDRLTLVRLLATGAAFAAAVASKNTALFLGPIAVLLVGLRLVSRRDWAVAWRGRLIELRGRARVRPALLLLGGLALSSWIGVWAAYGFSRHDAGRDPLDEIGAPAGLAAAAALLPQPYLQGLVDIPRFASSYRCYALGRIYEHAPWWYFPLALAVKSPLPLLLLAGAGLLLLCRGPRPPGVAALLVPPAVLLAAAMASGAGIGVRHVLPVLPFLHIFGGLAAARLAALGRAGGPVAAALLLWLVVGTVRVSPHFLATFNEIAGGPEHGLEWLADSNLDWGQDLPALADWMRDNDVSWINLAYFGNADPGFYGIESVPIPGTTSNLGIAAGPPRLPGLVAVSATTLSGLYVEPPVRAWLERLLTGAELRARIGGSILVFDVDATANRPPAGS